jgi:hypothetical protein
MDCEAAGGAIVHDQWGQTRLISNPLAIAYWNVGMLLSWLMPAPVKTTILVFSVWLFMTG